ncbi:MAG TPA: TonB-dependent receptor plug domain-containing protein, partial [bacterium]
MRRSLANWTAAALLAIGLLGQAAPLGAVTEAEQTFLGIYFTPDELHVLSTTRSLKSINRIAENVQVITAADIELLQAHSLAEVLETVTGLAVENRGMPGSVFSPYIQGSQFTQIAAFLDGIRLSNLGNNFPELTFLPVDDIARIEVIKGPASSTWGSALGGVINIITKNAPQQPGNSGAVSASAGKDNTTDVRGSLAGRVGATGYGIWASRLRSDGLVPGYAVERNAITAKLDYRASPAWNAGLALYWTGAGRGEGLYPEYDEADRSTADHLRAQFAAEGFLPGGGQVNFALWTANNRDAVIFESMSDGTEFFHGFNEDRMLGSDLRYRRAFAGHDVVLGAGFLSGR